MFNELKSLVEALPDYNLSSKGDLLLKAILPVIEEGISGAEFSQDHYCRKLVHRIRDFDVVLIGWLPGQHSPIHNHPSNGCLVYPIKGTLNEDRFCEELNPKGSANLTVGSYCYIDNGICIHQLGNASDTEKAISLHIYSPSNFKATIFHKEGNRDLAVNLQP